MRSVSEVGRTLVVSWSALVAVLSRIQPTFELKPTNFRAKAAGDCRVRTTQFLNIVGASQVAEIQHLQNSRIHFDLLVGNNQDFLALVRMLEEAETMRYYSFGFSELEDVKKSLERFSRIPGAEREDFTEIRSTNFPKRIVIPLNHQKELKIYVEETSMEDTKYCDKPYIVKIKV
ncbi:hypothetical protein CRE_12005 [Caenorhabditis remanei]|uniref:Uncharacterized protein n=1 Tax=Caenorhabditis remanei TaxID=31234 RepID=E3MPP4_CAERE|nr:hypothetical protein CRE_12005 [Caenorhabditis remanei]